MRSAFGRISVMEVRRCPLKSEGRASSAFPLFVCIHALQAHSGPKSIANCFRLSSPTFDPMSPSNALRPCLNRAGEEALPSFFGNHPISSGFLRKISSRAIWPIPTTEKDRDKPSSRFLHIYASVCTSYAAVCTNYALFCQSRKVNKE